jgi:hypothetical protein
MDFANACPLVRPCLPRIRLLFVGSRFRSTLPSDGPSQFRPCASLVLHLHQVAQGTFTPRLPDMPGTQAASGLSSGSTASSRAICRIASLAVHSGGGRGRRATACASGTRRTGRQARNRSVRSPPWAAAVPPAAAARGGTCPGPGAPAAPARWWRLRFRPGRSTAGAAPRLPPRRRRCRSALSVALNFILDQAVNPLRLHRPFALSAALSGVLTLNGCTVSALAGFFPAVRRQNDLDKWRAKSRRRVRLHV